MKIVLFILATISIIISLYLIKHNQFVIAVTFFIIGSLLYVICLQSKSINKIKLQEFEIEFGNNECKTFVNVAIELLENNFPILTQVSQKEVNQRVSKWLKEFLSEIEKQEVSIAETKLFYDPDFQYVLNKAIEAVGRRDSDLINKALINFLIDRIKYNDTKRDDLIIQLDHVITDEIPRLSENHYKLMSLVKYLVEINRIFPNISSVDEFNRKVIKGLEIFYIEDIRCYEDLKKTSFIHNGGNPTLSSPQQKEEVDKFSNGKIERPPRICSDLFTYFKIVYPFLNDITEDEKQSILSDERFKKYNVLYNRILRYILLLPFGEGLIYDYIKGKLEQTFNEDLEK